MTVDRGDVLLCDLDPVVGREQAGRRPCVVLSPASIANNQRFPIIVIVPVTGAMGLGNLYPTLQPYPNGLTKPSSVLIDHVRGIDKGRVLKQYARLPSTDLKKIDDAMRRFLGL